MTRLENDEFLSQLKQLLESQQESGSVFITQKRCTHDPSADAQTAESQQDSEMAEASTSTPDQREYPVIIKATNGKRAEKKIKISTLVYVKDYPTFTAAYGQLLKSSFTSLRKKDKKKKEAKKAALAAARAKNQPAADGKTKSAPTASTVLPKVTAPRRGAGHAKRQRQEKARKKALERHLESKRRRQKEDKSATGIKL